MANVKRGFGVEFAKKPAELDAEYPIRSWQAAVHSRYLISDNIVILIRARYSMV